MTYAKTSSRPYFPTGVKAFHALSLKTGKQIPGFVETTASGSVILSPAPNWSDLFGSTVTNFQQMLGIGQTITLSVEPTGTSMADTLSVYRNSTASTVGATQTFLSPTATSTFTVTPNQYVAFSFSYTYGIGYFTIRNVSNGNVVIDSIQFDNT